MTPADLVLETVLVVLAKGLAAMCIVAMVAIIGAALIRGRGAESVWPDGLESQQADAPPPTEK